MTIRINKVTLDKWRKKRSVGSTDITRCGNTDFQWGKRTYVMGILNMSPDSFSGDGIADIGQAVAQAQRFVAEGADIIDIGGESTRPGTAPLSTEEAIAQELHRVIPIVKKLSASINVPLSIDTYHHEVARQALDAGAQMINDIWGLKKDINLARLAADNNVPMILMSNQREKQKRYIMSGVIADLKWSINTALDAGVPWDNIIIDPGIGFGKTLEQNLEILRKLDELKVLGRPILLATSRKSVIASTLGLPPDQRVEGTAATIAIGITKGADMVRVHDVKEMVRVCRMSDAIIRG
jgi:dihydropteroate synthase